MPIDSLNLYRTLDSAFEEVKRQLNDTSEKNLQVRLTFWAGYGKEPDIDLEVSENYKDLVKVTGVDLQAMVDETKHRMSWQRGQTTQLLGHTVDSTAEEVPVEEAGELTPAEPETSDEIPF